MSTQINANVLANFITKHIGADKLAKDKPSEYDINNKEFNEANENDNNYLEIDEILDNDDLYEKFATLFVQEQEVNNEKDAEKEKEEKNKVKDKNGAGAA